MTRTAFIYGGLAGLIIIISIITGLVLSGGEGAGGSQWLGYLIMLVALTLIFIGVKRYRDRDLGGVIKFGRAFMLGFAIALVASIIYVAVWELYLAQTDYAFISDYTAKFIESKKSAGVAGAELEKIVADMEKMKAQYARVFYRLPITFLEIFPVGLIVALVSALLLRNEKFLPARA